VPFNRPTLLGGELDNIRAAISSGKVAGDGQFTKLCNAWLEARLGAAGALLTHSCTAALEMAAILCDLQPGDEVIMPSFTFVSTANAVVLRGAVPVFVDIDPANLNIDPASIEAAVTERTKAIFVVHYAGVPCDMDAINAIAQARGIMVVEDAAQALGSTYKGRPAGMLADMAAFSFHETKNLNSGEGGALVLAKEGHGERAEIIREKGTNRSRFFRGQIDKYTWVDIGSSYLPSDILAAYLLPSSMQTGLPLGNIITKHWQGLNWTVISNDHKFPIMPCITAISTTSFLVIASIGTISLQSCAGMGLGRSFTTFHCIQARRA
jgi:dTDP-4-amino-4,6-dideoxygalactose transaminase